jgi:hypothetical protein
MADEPEPNSASGSEPPPPTGAEPPLSVSPPPAPSSEPPPSASPPGSWPTSSKTSSGNRGGVIMGAVLILVGALFLAERTFGVELGRFGWPLFVIVPGILLMAWSLTVKGREGSGLAVSGAITTVVGLVLAVQNATGLWATWAYAWALVGPGATGVGLIFYGTARHQRDLVSAGLRSLGGGLALFAVFGLFFEGIIGLSGEPFLLNSDLLPVALIGLGVVLVGWSVVGGRRRA